MNKTTRRIFSGLLAVAVAGLLCGTFAFYGFDSELSFWSLLGRHGTAEMPGAEPYPYVYVNADGTIQELHPNQRQYLETEFAPGDGGAPSIKTSYLQRNGWGELKGFLARSQVPGGTQIMEAPAEDPSRPMNRSE